MPGGIIVRCGSCGTLNRAPAEKAGMEGRCGSCGAGFTVPPARPVDVTDASFGDEVGRSGIPVLVEFWSPSCGHCLRMEPVLEGLAGELSGRMKVAKVDVSKNSGLPSDYEIRGTPAFLVFVGGREAARFIGAMPGEEILNRVRAFIS